MQPPVIATVLKSGGEYKPHHVERLYRQAKEHAPDVPFVCFSDVPLPEGIRRIALTNNWPGWWSKIEVFKMEGPVVYMDLDTTIVGPIDNVIAAGISAPFVALRDFNPHAREMGSGLMAWSGDMKPVYGFFAQNAEAHMARCQTPRYWGDQGYLEGVTPGRLYWQDLVPGAIVSYKKHCQNGIPDGARIVCYHGKPRPWEVEH